MVTYAKRLTFVHGILSLLNRRFTHSQTENIMLLSDEGTRFAPKNLHQGSHPHSYTPLFLENEAQQENNCLRLLANGKMR